MDIDLDMTVLNLSYEQQEALKYRQVKMACSDGHEVQVRLMKGSGSSIIYCPQCHKPIAPRIGEAQEQSA
jgi:hypothetical protein